MDKTGLADPGPGYPWSGQVACFDASGRIIPCTGTGQDGQYRTGRPWPAPRFELPGEGLVRDRLTGLFWPRDAGNMAWPMTWDQARAWVEERNQEGFLGQQSGQGFP